MRVEEKFSADATEKKRGRGRPPKDGGPAKRDIRCSITDVYRQEIETVRYPDEKSIASFVNRAVREEIYRRRQKRQRASIPDEQLSILQWLEMHVIDEEKIRLLKIVKETNSKKEMHQKLLDATQSVYNMPRRI